jgi:hypothetical protein
MLELNAAPEFLQGSIVGALSIALVLLYLRYVDTRLMACQCPVPPTLTITHYFRAFVALLVACSVIISPTLLKMGLAGSPSELLFAMLMALLSNIIAGYLAVQAFLTRVEIHGTTITTHSPLGKKTINLNNLTRVSINGRFQFELSDSDHTIRFCHYVNSKPALIEHMIQHAPYESTRGLRALWQPANSLHRLDWPGDETPKKAG